MRDQFVADVADFGKYGLCRWLCGVTDEAALKFPMGVVWYFQLGCVKVGGDKTEYLFGKQREDYRACDPELWETMKRLVCENKRKVAEVEQSKILPADRRYYRETVEYSGIPNNKPSERKEKYEAAGSWLAGAVERVRGAEIVLLDPDKKITDSEPRIGANGPLYAHPKEIKAFWDAGHSLVIYHQTGGKAPLDGVRETANRLQNELGTEPIPLWFRPAGWTLIFFVIPQTCHREGIEARLRQMLASPWCKYFEEL